MSEGSLPAPILLHHTGEVAAQRAEPPSADLPAPTTEQVRTADQAFAGNEESDEVLRLLSLQAGIVLLHDLAAETFSTSDDEEERRNRLGDRPADKPDGSER
jgi:hypothetical protein